MGALFLKKTLNEIAAIVNGSVDGDGSIVVNGLAGIREAGPDTLSFISNEKYLPLLEGARAAALVVARDLAVSGFSLVRVDDPALAWDRLLDLVKPPAIELPEGIHSTAFVAETATLGKDVRIAHNAVVMDGARIGDKTVIFPNVYVGHATRIGRDCLVYPNVVIRERTEIHDRVVIQPGAVIGSDGFGYHESKGRIIKQEQYGIVVLEDDVEIGANVTIDRARLHETRIGQGTKIDNLVQIAHNVQVGRHSILVSQVGVAGSTSLGQGVIMAGQSGAAGHITIGDGVIVAARAGVTKDVEPKEVVYGNPAGKRVAKQREVIGIRKIPALLEAVRTLKERIARLEAQSGND